MTDLPAGPELDRLVAEKVMGWTIDGVEWRGSAAAAERLTQDPHAIFYRDCAGYPEWMPSENIANAWEAVTAMNARGYRLVLRSDEDGTAFTANFPVQGEHGELVWRDLGQTALSAPLAICRAALKAVGHA